MFDNLSDRLLTTLNSVRGKARLTEKNIRSALKDVRNALIEADVALPVVKKFTEQIRVKAVGRTVMKSLTPGQAFVKVVKDELTQVMGKVNEELDLKAVPPVVVLMAGLQGAGKTTTVAKLALLLTKRQKKKVLVVSVDVYRPAAIEQLKTLADDISVACFDSDPTQKPIDIAKAAIKEAKSRVYDVVLVDTAGRLHIDDEMMSEIKALHKELKPTETLFVVDSMTGQDAANTAKAFGEALPLTGVILTKADGDARGGAALSVKAITGKPIKFIGVGEKTEALEPFHPDRIASQILGMGDIMSLIEDAEHKVDHEKAQKLAKKIQEGKTFNLEDFAEQLDQMQKMGGVGKMITKMPMFGKKIPSNVEDMVNDKSIKRMQSIIGSMTLKERRAPAIINGSRRKRIANGSGTEIQEVNNLLKQHDTMRKMMKKVSKGQGMRQMQQMAQMMGGGQMPPGM